MSELGMEIQHGTVQVERCCSACDAKQRCHVCDEMTQFACSDCRVDLGATVYVCPKKECRAAHEAKCSWVLRERIAQSRQNPRQQWWLAEIDQHGNPKLTDGAHSSIEGCEKALYLIDAISCLGRRGRKFAAAKVELFDVSPLPHGANKEAISTLNASPDAQGSVTEQSQQKSRQDGES